MKEKPRDGKNLQKKVALQAGCNSFNVGHGMAEYDGC